MNEIKTVAVFCGSNSGVNPAYTQAASDLGALLAKQNINIVFGGANVGLMHSLASSALEQGGYVTGVMTAFLEAKELVYEGVSESIIVDTMPERKKIMFDRSDAFILLPGGTGSYEEFFEIWTLVQLHKQLKPLGILNIANFYDPMLAMLKNAVAEKFMAEEHFNMAAVSEQVDDILEKMRQVDLSYRPEWLDAELNTKD
tara:strand:+ start:72297 stop:72896 length:600 start_codon:yes stop_codon:yes gene_type:complete